MHESFSNLPPPSASLGSVVEEFRADANQIIAGILVGVLAFGGGLVAAFFLIDAAHHRNWDLTWWQKNDLTWPKFLGGMLFASFLVCLGAFMWRWMASSIGHHIQICDHGFQFGTRSGADEVLWSDVAEIHETVTWERLPLLKGPLKFLLPKKEYRSVAVRTQQGKRFEFGVRTFERAGRLNELVADLARRHGLPWSTETLNL